MSLRIVDFHCVRSQYRPGAPIELTLQVECTAAQRLRLDLTVTRLAAVVGTSSRELTANAGDNRIEITLAPRAELRAAFGVDLIITTERGEVETTSTAFDVSDNPDARVRYGFLSDFRTDELGDLSDVEDLAKLHVTHVQLYDWMYRHDTLVSPTRHYVDPMGKEIDLDVVRQKIDACHDRGIRAIAYGAVYAATTEFASQHRDWALTHRDGTPYSFIERFTIMDISAGSAWSGHISEQYRLAVERLGFDGVHMDTYGFPKSAFAVYRDGGAGAGGATAIGAGGGAFAEIAGATANVRRREVHLDDAFPALIALVRRTLGDDKTIIFNNVGGWPVEKTGPAPQNAVYIEVWKPFDRYYHLAELVQRGLRAGKPVVIAAYIEPFKGANDERTLAGAETAALLAMAVITSAGGSHLLLGERGGILMQAYYVDHATARAPFVHMLRRYCDFVVRYSELFYDPALTDVTTTHLGVDVPDYEISGAPLTQTGEAGRVWAMVRESPQRKVIFLVNLVGLEDDVWNRGHAAPAPQSGLHVETRVNRDIRAVYCAAPDASSAAPCRLDYRVSGDFGEMLSFDLPTLTLWAVAVIELEEGTSG